MLSIKILLQTRAQIFDHLLLERKGLDDLDKRRIGLGKLLHRRLVDVGGHGDLLVAFVAEPHILAEHVDDIAEHRLVRAEDHAGILAREHIDMLFHICRQVELSAVGTCERFKGLRALGEKLHIRHAVDAVVADVVVFVIVTDEVILALLGDQLIWVDDILPRRAVGMPAAMQLLIRMILKIAEPHLAAAVDRLVEQLHIIKQLLIVGLIPGRHARDVLHARSEVDVRELRELFDQLLVLLIRDMAGEQHAVDEQAQLAVGELAFEIKVRENDVLLLAAVLIAGGTRGFTVIDVVAELDQVHQVAFDRLAVNRHIVLAAEDILNLALAETVVLVRIALEDIQYIHDDQLLGLLCVHNIILPNRVDYTQKANCPLRASFALIKLSFSGSTDST